MGASQSIKKSSKSNPIKGDGQSSTRKFQSYHLPFHKEKGEKGFAKFKRSILGKKKPKTEPYQHTLSTLTSTSLQNLPDHEHSPSLDSRGQSTNGTQFYTWGPRKHTQRPRCPSPPKEEENKDTEIQFQEVDLNSGDRNGVKNDDLMCSSKIVTDTYSAVLKKKDDINIAETQRKESSSSSSGEKSANSVFEDASDELPQAVQQALDETSKDNEELSKMTEAPCEMQLETTVEKDNSEVPTSSTLTSTTDTIENNKQYSIAQRQDSDSSSERSGSVGEDGAPCYSSASTGVISRNSSGDVPWEDVDDGITTEDVHHSTQIQLQCEQVESSNQFLVRKELETITTNTLEEVKASSTSECDIKPASEANEDKDVKEDSAIPKPKDVGQLSLIEVPDQSEVNTNDGSKNTEQRNELTDVDRAVTATSSTITDPEQALDGHLHPLAIAQESNQTVEMEPPNNSNIASSIKVSDIIEFSEESAEQDQQKEPSNGSSALEPTNQHNKQPNAKEEALTTSTSGLPLKKSSSTSSEEKVSRNASSDSSSDIDDDVWDDDTRNPKSPEAIK